ncbi:MAG TPA: ATP synthase F0 subunit B [Candidatus Acidoferrum sp.]|jgi:F-type H+-transporting ATPase subunit b
MKRLKNYLMAVLPTIFLLLASAVHAAEEGGNGAGHSTTEIFKWIHFAILAGLLYWVFGKLLPPTFRKKSDLISEAISKATKAKAEAEQQLKEAAAKLASLEQEVAAFRAIAQQEGMAEVQRLSNATKSDAEKIFAAGKAEIEAAERSARLELKELAAKLSVDKAESLVAQQMSPGVQDALIENFVQSLQGRPN